MGLSGNELIDGDRELIVDVLDALYCRHLVAMHYALAIGNRLSGQALFLLNDELEELASENLGSARKLAQRIAELDGAVTGDPAALADRSGHGSFELPDCSDLAAILTTGLAAARATIRAYGDALAATAGDEITHQLLLAIVRREVARESDLEAVVPA